MKDISSQTDHFFERMLIYFPNKRSEYEMSVHKYRERLETVIIENIFLPELIEMIRINKRTDLLQSIFEYFEEVSNCDGEHLINIFSITVLEVLGNDRAILMTAQDYMGSKTKQLQEEADRGLGRI